MKTLRINLTQEPEGNAFRVVSWTNSTQLSVGQVVPAAVVAGWCERANIQVNVMGLTPVAQESLDLIGEEALA